MWKKWFGEIDKPVFWISILICVPLTIIGMVNPDLIGSAGGAINNWIYKYFGWWYMFAVGGYLVFLAWVALSKYGKIKLGKDSDKPEFSFFSWFAMLFNAGLGVGFLFWVVAEPLYHTMTPPPGNGVPGTWEAVENAFKIYLLNWGMHGWAPYAVVGLAIAYYTFRLGRPLTVATGLIGLLGDNPERTFWGKVINILTVFATMFGSATSLGLGVMQIRYGLDLLFHIPPTVQTAVTVTAIIACLYIWSSVRGIDSGIKIISDSNQWLAFGLMIFIFVLGPTTFILNIWVNTIGSFANNFFHLTFWTDPMDEGKGWLSWWTIFYWAWFISWSPWVGAFVARISKGRTIRQFVIGTLLFPTLFALTWGSIIGGAGVHAQLLGGHDLWTGIQASVQSGMFSLFQLYPLFMITGPIIIASAVIFFVTGADAASYTVAMIMNKGSLNPSNGMKIIWGTLMATVALVLLLGGGLAALQAASLVSALPFSFAIMAFAYSLVVGLQNDALIVQGQLPKDLRLRLEPASDNVVEVGGEPKIS